MKAVECIYEYIVLTLFLHSVLNQDIYHCSFSAYIYFKNEYKKKIEKNEQKNQL